MPYLVLFNKLSFQRVDPLDPKVPIGAPVEVARGGFVPDWVTSFEVNAMMNAGMITSVSSRDDAPAIVPVEAVAPRDRTPDQPNILPSDPNGVPPVVAGQGVEADLTGWQERLTSPVVVGEEPASGGETIGALPGSEVTTEPVTSETPGDPGETPADPANTADHPKAGDNRAEWERYAIRTGAVREDEAAGKSKAQLMNAVAAKEQADREQ